MMQSENESPRSPQDTAASMGIFDGAPLLSAAEMCAAEAGAIEGGTPGLVGYLLVGSGSTVISDPPGAFGDLCLGGAALGRYIADAQVIDASGQIVTDVINGNVGGGVGNLPGGLGGAIMPGDTWNWQYWARVSVFGSTFSDALTVTFQ